MVEISSRYYSRQIAALGVESFHRIQNLHVLISGLRGMGIECAKNLILTGVGQVTIHDDNIVQQNDLSTNFFLSHEDVGVKTRSQASLPRIQNLNSQVKVHCKEGKIEELFISQFSLVVFADTSINNLIHLNHYCRTKNPPIGFLCSENWGAFGYLFVDLGPEFITYDKTGEENKSYFISSITKENPGIVTVYDRHFLHDGDYVVFKEVQGMEEINNTPPRPVRVVNSVSFSIEDTTGYSNYFREGIVEQFKIPEKFRFKSLEFNLTKPSLIGSDIERSEQRHLCIRAISEFVKIKGNLPAFKSESDAEEVYSLAVSINNTSKENNTSYLSSIDKWLIYKVSMHTDCQFSPIASFWGALCSLEVIKFTGKYTPLMQWMSHDWLDIVPEYYAQYSAGSLIPDDLKEKLSNLKYCIVGIGALGSEILKQSIQLGVKSFILNDYSKIKASDRHIFYSSENVGMLKTNIIEQKILNKDENLKINTIQGPFDKIEISDDDWESTKLVISAVDNHVSRESIDRACIWHEKDMIEGGISNIIGYCNIYKPFKTQCYSEAFTSDPEKNACADIISSFPYNIEQCIEFAKLKFKGYYYDIGNDLSAFLEDPTNFLSAIHESEKVQKMQLIYSYLELLQHNSFEECVKFAKEKFNEFFHDMIINLTTSFPPDAKDNDGKAFWCGYKRLPSPIPFENNEELHLQFIESFSTILSQTLGIQYVQLNLKEIGDPRPQIRKYSVSDLQAILSAQIPKQYLTQICPQQFDIEDSLHVNFIFALSSLRARCYKIIEIDRFSTEIIAGKINGSLPSTVSAVASCVCLEAYRLLLNFNSNSMINLGANLYYIWEPLEPKKKKSIEFDPNLCAPVKAYPEGFTVWDKIVINGPLTLIGLLEKFSEEFNLKISLITLEKVCVYNCFTEGNEKMDKTIEEIFEEIAPKRNLKYLSVEVSCEEMETNIEVVTPIIKYNLSY